MNNLMQILYFPYKSYTIEDTEKKHEKG